ncbi:unnamed protein product [Orchesella dallaii]|uniref:Protein kinase domain-containing protein n=1 Tax=Orchesella dallaii TaxID=48710 RepID=A0ABP1RQ51_9HEXA
MLLPLKNDIKLLQYFDAVNIEVPEFVHFLNYPLFSKEIVSIINNVSLLVQHDIKLWITIPVNHSTHNFALIDSRPYHNSEALARHANAMKQITTKFSLENNVSFILTGITNQHYFKGLTRNASYISESFFSHASQNLIYLRQRGYFPSTNNSISALETGVQLVTQKFTKILMDFEPFMEEEKYCKILETTEFVSFKPSIRRKEIWLNVYSKSEENSIQFGTFLSNITAHREVYECVTGIIITVDDLLLHIGTQRRLHHQIRESWSSMIKNFQLSLKLINISLTVTLDLYKSTVSLGSSHRQMMQNGNELSTSQMVVNVSDYFVWVLTIQLEPSPQNVKVFYKRLYQNLLQEVSYLEQIMDKFPSIKPILAVKVIWSPERYPNRCAFSEHIAPIDVLDTVNSMMYIYQTHVLELVSVTVHTSLEFLYGRWNALPGTERFNKLVYTPVESSPCIPWNQHHQNKSESRHHLSGISVDDSIFSKIGNFKTKGVSVPYEFLLNTFVNVEIMLNTTTLSTILDWSRLATTNRNTTFKMYISLPENEIHFKQNIDKVGKLQNRSGHDTNFVAGIHIPIDFTLNQLVPFETPEEFEEMVVASNKRNISIGVLFKNCALAINWNFSKVGLAILRHANYVICDLHNLRYEMSDKGDVNYLPISQYLGIPRLLRWNLVTNYNISATVMLRIGWPKDFNMNEKENSIEYLKFSNLVFEVCKAYGFQYFLYHAFETNRSKYSGWWRFNEPGDILDANLYVERVSEALGTQSWRPPVETELKPEVSASSRNIWIIGSVTVTLLLIALVVGRTRQWMTRRNKSLLSDEEIEEFFNEGASVESDVEQMALYIGLNIHYDRDLEIPSNKFQIDKKCRLGSGNFGTVYKASIEKNCGVQEVAVKVPMPGSKEALKSILCEIKLMSFIGGHPNVLQLVAACTFEIRKGNVYVFTEFCSNGSLISFLKLQAAKLEAGNVTKPKLLETIQCFCRFGREIADGMKYIGSKKVVHGDLSARNILLDENLVCKISDFGLSTKLYNSLYVNKKLAYIPWRWMAIESLDRMTFSSKSDVWSFAVILWEIFTLGAVPYSSLNWSPEFITMLTNGVRLPKPKYASMELYQSMRTCWNTNPSSRPRFKTLSNALNVFESTLHGQDMESNV